MADEEPPHRRLRLNLDLEADDLHELAHALMAIGNDLELEGAEMREVTSGGYASGHHLVLACDDSMDHDRFASELAAWMQERRPNRTNEEHAHG